MGLGGGLEAGRAYVDLIPRLAPGFSSEASSAISQGIKPATAQLTGDLTKAGTVGGTQAGTAAAAGLGSRLKAGASGIAGNITGIFAAVGAVHFLGGALDEARESIRVGNLTEAVIKSTGGAAQITAGHVGDLANKLSLMAGVDDELIQNGENVLLTFTNVRNEAGKGNDVFDRAVGLALDLSQALGQDMQSSAIQLGKALNDPIKGVTALQRVGVSFTAQQKDQIKTLVESGDVLGAQKIILAELTKEFGGAAAAAADPVAKAEVAWGNLKETLGTALLPVVTQVATVFANDVAPAITAIVGAFTSLPAPVRTALILLVGLAAAGAGIGKLVGGLGSLLSIFKLVGTGFQALSAILLANPWVLVVAAVIAAVVLIIQNWDEVRAFLEDTWQAITDAAVAAWDWIKSFFAEWWPLLLAIFTGGLSLIVGLIVNNWAAIRDFTVSVWNAIVGFLAGIPGWILGVLSSIPGLLMGLFTYALGLVWGAVVGGFNNVVGFVAGIPGAILGALGDLGGLLFDAGANIMQGLWNGLQSVAGGLLDWAGGIASDLLDEFTGLFDLGSPSRTMRRAGGYIVEGLELGLRDKAADVLATAAGVGGGVAGRLTGTANFRALPSLGESPAPVGTLAQSVPLRSSASSSSDELAPLVVQGPLVELSGPVSIRDDSDITKLSRELDREVNRSARARGKAVAPR